MGVIADIKDILSLIKEGRQFVDDLISEKEKNKETVISDKLYIISSEAFGYTYVSDGVIAFPICKSIGRVIMEIDDRLINHVNTNVVYFINIDSLQKGMEEKKVKLSKTSISSFINFGRFYPDVLRSLIMSYAPGRNLSSVKDIVFRKPMADDIKDFVNLLLQPGLTILVGKKASGKNLFFKAIENHVDVSRIDIGEPEPDSLPMTEGLAILSYFFPYDVRVKLVNSAKGLQTMSQKNLGAGGISQTFIDDLESISSFCERKGRNTLLSFNPKSNDEKQLNDLFALTLPAAIQVVAKISGLSQVSDSKEIISNLDITIESRNLKREPLVFHVVLRTEISKAGFRDDSTTTINSVKMVKSGSSNTKNFSNVLRGGI